MCGPHTQVARLDCDSDEPHSRALNAQRPGPWRRYLGAVAPRLRVLAFGSAAALVVAGSICAALVGGLTGEVLAIALITLGLGAVVLLMFLEVGLTEERELAREEKQRRQPATDGERRLRPRRRPRRPG
jgi:hypothetical protein